MGLDNGWTIRSNRRVIRREMLPEELVYAFDSDYGEFPEINYHRKDWGLRNDIINYFDTSDAEINWLFSII